MQTLRKKILSKLSSEPKIAKKIKIDQQDYAIHVFDRSKLQKFLSEKTFFQMQQCIEKQIPISPVIADQIASAMKAWAIANGASHYTHWFQPLTGVTAEKHDSFLILIVLEISWKNLRVNNWFSKFLNSQISQKVELEILLKLEDILHGIRLHLLFYMGQPCVFQQPLCHIQELH